MSVMDSEIAFMYDCLIQYPFSDAQTCRLASLLLFINHPFIFEDTIMKKVIIASLAAMFVLTGCNTFKGLGQDVSSAGNAVSGSAQEVQNKI